MKLVAASLAAAALLTLAPAAFADETAWHFKPGKTLSYECTSEYHYVDIVRRTRRSDPQWETFGLRATVLAVGDDGSARLEFVVERVAIVVRFDDTGASAEWDSAKSSKTELPGFRPYQAIVGHKFQAVIGPDGAVKEMTDGDWPKSDLAGTVRDDAHERQNLAADAVHPPTTAATWLDFIFATAPHNAASWQTTIRMPQNELLTAKTDGTETVLGKLCLMTQLKSTEKERGLKPGDVHVSGPADTGKIAAAILEASQKKGTSWFSKADGVMVKCEFEGSGEYGQSRRETTQEIMKWGVELKGQGVVEIRPTDSETPNAPTK